MRLVRSVTTTTSAVPRRGYYQPPAEARTEASRKVVEPASDGGIATFADMLPDAQEARLARFRQQTLKDNLMKSQMNKEQFEKFSKELQEKRTRGALTKVPTTVEELPQSDQDWLAGKDPSHPLKYHPFVMKRAKAMLAGTWIPAVGRNLDPNFLDEFKQPLNRPDAWIEYLNNWEGDYWGPLGYVSPRMGMARCKETLPYIKALLRAMLRAKKGQNPDRVGNLPSAMLDIVYDHQFIMSEKPDEDVWNIVMEATVQNGEWRLGYWIEDIMIDLKMKPNADALKRLDEIAQFAWEKGYMEPPNMQGKELQDIFKVDTHGGVGAYFPIPRGESYGFELFELYERQKKDGTFKPAVGTPAWDEFTKDKPELRGQPTDLMDVLIAQQFDSEKVTAK
eukprot:TRINITY_DN56058_c0_g1_i1.p2 TRINITY_DN56058_c0_g1~~TRINITY_DN56058_c0_g1_i1.p2  ORF type:complete len:411 (-),score=105.23 TRINITY_DN56058_c0_g1_i1:442-1620(-)